MQSTEDIMGECPPHPLPDPSRVATCTQQPGLPSEPAHHSSVLSQAVLGWCQVPWLGWALSKSSEVGWRWVRNAQEPEVLDRGSQNQGGGWMTPAGTWGLGLSDRTWRQPGMHRVTECVRTGICKCQIWLTINCFTGQLTLASMRPTTVPLLWLPLGHLR